MAKLTLQDLTNILTSATTINNNNTLIENAIENTLSRDGTTPNEWEATMDANSQRLINNPDPVDAQEYVTLNHLDTVYTSTIDHGLLQGLADDDHTQYHNDARGDVRYYTQTLLDAGQLDNRYFTETEISANAGSSLVGFTNGGTGSVDRTVDAKLKELVTAEDFGAVGDGVTDDTTALTNACASAQKVTFTAGSTYLITTQLIVEENVNVDLNGATIEIGAAFGTSTPAVRLDDGSSLRNGTINIATTFDVDRVIQVGANCVVEHMVISSVDQISNRDSSLDAAVRFSGASSYGRNIVVENFDNAFAVLSVDSVTLQNIRARSYVRGLYCSESDFLNVAGFHAETQSANATTDPGHNGLLIEECRRGTFSDIFITESGEHGIRIGGSSAHGSEFLTFGNIVVNRPGQCGFKINDGTNRTGNIQVNGLQTVDCSWANATGTNEDGLRIEDSDIVTVYGFSNYAVDQADASYNGIYITNSTKVTIDSPNIQDTADSGIMIDDDQGSFTDIRVNNAKLFNTGSHGINVNSPTQIIRSVVIINAFIFNQGGWGILFTANSPTVGVNQPCVLNAYIDNAGSGRISVSTTDGDVYQEVTNI